jgi:predicted metal-dependent phosphoesterase TrpH
LVLKMDLHVHSCYSHDGISSIREIIEYSKKRGLNGVALTDHNTCEGSMQLSRTNELLVLPGMEIDTTGGHILALNISKPVPSKLNPLETIRRIHEAGGIAVAAHPYAFGKTGKRQQLTKTSNFDAVEVVNSSAFPFFLSTNLSRKWAQQLGLPQTAGSDSHIPQTIGMAYTVIDADPEIDEIVRAIKKGATVPVGSSVPWTMRLRKLSRGLRKMATREATRDLRFDRGQTRFSGFS